MRGDLTSRRAFCFPMSDIERIWITDAVKAVDGTLKLRVLGGPYGIDKQGHEFHAGTDFADLPIVPVISYHGWDALDGQRIGWASKAERDSAGQWYEVTLDNTATGKRLYSDAQAGKVRASSDSISHLIRPLEALKGYRGKINRWPIAAISLMGADKYNTAINPRAIAVPALKAFYEELITSIEANDSGESAAKAGAVFAGRNTARIKQLRQLIDELLAEMPDAFQESNIQAAVAPQSDASAGGNGAKAVMDEKELLSKIESVIDLKFTAAAKAEAERKQAEAEAATEAGKHEAAVKAAVDAAIEAKVKELDANAAKAGRPKFSGGADQTKPPASGEDDAAAKAFRHYMFTGDRSQIAAAKATMNETTAGQGGYLVPTLYSNEIVQALKEGSILRLAGAKVLSVAGTNSFKVPTLANTTRAVKTAESAAFNQAEPTLGEVTFAPIKYTRLSKVTDELLADSRFDVFSQIIAPDAANAFILGENDDFTVGDGSGDPQGVVVGSSLGKAAAGATAITADEVIDLFHSLSYLYRPNAVWMMNDATLGYVRKLKDSTGQYLWQPGLANGQPPTILGRPVFTNNNMATIATGAKTVLFGDMSYFWIADFGQLEMRRLDELYAGTGEVGFRWFQRYDAHVMLSAAIKHLIQA